jgi:hypothetical protein
MIDAIIIPKSESVHFFSEIQQLFIPKNLYFFLNMIIKRILFFIFFHYKLFLSFF